MAGWTQRLSRWYDVFLDVGVSLIPVWVVLACLLAWLAYQL